MFIDSLILYGLVKELKTALLSSQVKQIHQTDTRVLDMELYRPMSSPIHLIFCAQNPPCLYMDSAKKRSQYIDSQTFCMTLRKNLEGSRLSNIEQIQLDRILCFSFDRIETGGQINSDGKRKNSGCADPKPQTAPRSFQSADIRSS